LEQQQQQQHDIDADEQRIGDQPAKEAYNEGPWNPPTKICHLPILSAAFLCGWISERIYIASIKAGQVSLKQIDQDHYSVQLESTKDVMLYELSDVGSDIFVIVYIMVLVRAIVRWRNAKPLNLDIPVKAVNWTIGLVLGLIVAVAQLVGVELVVCKHGWQVLASVLVRAAMCFVTYAIATEFQAQCIDSREPGAKEMREREYTPCTYAPVPIV
jgi:uncharacterized protein YacL